LKENKKNRGYFLEFFLKKFTFFDNELEDNSVFFDKKLESARFSRFPEKILIFYCAAVNPKSD